MGEINKEKEKSTIIRGSVKIVHKLHLKVLRFRNILCSSFIIFVNVVTWDKANGYTPNIYIFWGFSGNLTFSLLEFLYSPKPNMIRETTKKPKHWMLKLRTFHSWFDPSSSQISRSLWENLSQPTNHLWKTVSDFAILLMLFLSSKFTKLHHR